MTSAITNAVNTPPQQHAHPPTSTSAGNPTASDSHANGTATKQTPTQIAKAQAAAAVKVNPDGTTGPHHKARIRHIGQPGYKVNVKA